MNKALIFGLTVALSTASVASVVRSIKTEPVLHQSRISEIGDLMPRTSGVQLYRIPMWIERSDGTTRPLGVIYGKDYNRDGSANYEDIYRFCDSELQKYASFDLFNHMMYVDRNNDKTIDEVIPIDEELINRTLGMISTRCEEWK